MEPKQYIFKSDQSFDIGFIAEEVDLIDKNLVVYEDEYKNIPQNIQWNRIITYLIAEIKNLKNKLDLLQEK
jgi:hypothetical protein